MKEDRIDDLLASIPPSTGISLTEKEKKVQESVEKLLKVGVSDSELLCTSADV